MKIKPRYFFLTLLFIIVLMGLFYLLKVNNRNKILADSQTSINSAVQVVSDREVNIEIKPNNTYGILMSENGVTSTVANNILMAASKVYDLSKIRVGREIVLVYDAKTDKLKQLKYQIDTEEELFVNLIDDNWVAERKEIPYEVKTKTSAGVIESSLYESALAQGVDERAVVELANVFQWSIDFTYQVQKGDSYKFIYEERYLDGKYIMPGRILAGKFINEGKSYYVFYFEESEDNQAYFDEHGNSVQKMFLKAPVAYKYISSGFTTGSRYVQAFNVSTGHRAIDYAAAYGTPIRAVGDGTVIYAGWHGPYGNFVSIRHNSTFTTNYAHMSKIAVKYGQRVSQNQTIGYVGSTGFSTGPHVHYELVKNGVKVNPLKEILPPGKPIAKENMERFNQQIKEYKEKLD